VVVPSAANHTRRPRGRPTRSLRRERRRCGAAGPERSDATSAPTVSAAARPHPLARPSVRPMIVSIRCVGRAAALTASSLCTCRMEHWRHPISDGVTTNHVPETPLPVVVRWGMSFPAVDEACWPDEHGQAPLPGAISASAYADGFLRPGWSVRRGLGFAVEIDQEVGDPGPEGDASQAWKLYRGAGSDFSDRDRGLPALLRPHLYEAYRAQRRQTLMTPFLTAREHQVLRWVAAGYTNRQIGRRLSISEATGCKHLEHIFQRLQVTSRTAAVTRAFGEGM
jgi:DNA-binding CsgD family transcriptional regulator